MNRSVKDLRELICVSRLSYRGEEEDEELHNSNSDEDSLSSHQPFPAPRLPQRKNRELSSLDKDEKLVSPPLSAGSSGRGSPLPPIGKSPITSPNSSSRVSPVECNNRGLPAHSQKPKQTKPNFDDVLMYMDSTVLSEWLRRANDDVKELTSWLHAGDNFVSFAHFFLSEISNSKRRELVQLEFSIITEEVSFSFKAGTDCNQVTARDLDAYLSAILWEYPQQFSESRCAKTFLTILVNLCSGRKDNYRTLLSNVRCSTNNKQFVQQILATRAFAVLSLCSGILKFYKQITQQACNSSLGKDAPSGKDIIELVTDFAFQAVRKGFVDVLQFLLENFKLDPQTMKARDGKSLLFTAVICTQGEVLGFLLKLKPKLDFNEPAESGNSPLHAAVNSGNVAMVKMLIEAGASLDTWNAECEGATPLHLAIMSGNADIVSLLISAGCQTDVKMGVPATVTPFQLASDLGLEEIGELLSGCSMHR